MAFTREQCVSAAMAGGLPRQEAEDVVNTLLQERAVMEAVRGRGEIVSADQALADAWGSRMAREQSANAGERKQASLNILVRQQNDARINAVKEAGFSGMDAVEAILVGSDKRFFGARDSVDARRVAVKRDFMGGLLNELESLDEKESVRKLFNGDREFNRNVVREVLAPESTGDAAARQAADIFSRHMEKTRQRLNAVGADIGRLDGYLPPSHDPWKIARKGRHGVPARQAWVSFIRDKLDLKRSFPNETDPAELDDILGRVYDNINLGKGQGPTVIERGEYAGPRNMAARLGEHRILHFKDADAFMAYHEEYGRGSVLSGVLGHMESAGCKLSLMEMLGPNPEAMLKSIIAKEARLLREGLDDGLYGPEQAQSLQDLETAQTLRTGKVAAWFAELTGEANWPSDTSGARAMSLLRAGQTLSKLGGASLSAVADVFIKAMNMRVNGLTWGDALMQSTGRYFKRYGAEERAVARQVGGFVDDVTNELRARWDVNESLPGALGSIQDKLFRWSGLNWITESGKAGYAMWFSRHMGAVADKAHDALPPSHRAILDYHGISAARWDLMRQMTELSPNGERMLTPQTADRLSDDALRVALSNELSGLRASFKHNPDGLLRAEQALFERARRDLRADLMAMIADETQFAIIEPDAKTRAFMHQGARPGTVAGEFWRSVMQFKSFPIAYMQRRMGGRRRGRGELQQGMRHGWNTGSLRDADLYDMRGVTGAALSALTFGYLAMSLKDMGKGRTPRDPAKPETIFAALMQSGGAGILGDFFFNKVNRFGGDFAGALADPLAGETGRAVQVVSGMLRGDFVQGGEDALRMFLDNAPFVNLRYVREALNWLLLYHMRESMSPGTLARTERKMREEFNQSYPVSPARNIQKGGWGFR